MPGDCLITVLRSGAVTRATLPARARPLPGLKAFPTRLQIRACSDVRVATSSSV